MSRAEPLWIQPGLELPARELRFEFSRSGGPGGQNVNKVETRASLRFSVRDSTSLTAKQRAAIQRRLATRLLASGEIVVHASRYRERERNVDDARERLAELLRQALVEPKRRRPTRPTRGSQERRIAGKSRRADIKRGRRDGHDS